jgi:hypothetical protein
MDNQLQRKEALRCIGFTEMGEPCTRVAAKRYSQYCTAHKDQAEGIVPKSTKNQLLDAKIEIKKLTKQLNAIKSIFTRDEIAAKNRERRQTGGISTKE